MSVHESPPAIALEDSILDVLMRAGSGTLSAPEIAHAIAPEGDWHGLLMPIRRAAVALAQSGRLVIYRKGKPADPDDFRGVYRLGLPRRDWAAISECFRPRRRVRIQVCAASAANTVSGACAMTARSARA